MRDALNLRSLLLVVGVSAFALAPPVAPAAFASPGGANGVKAGECLLDPPTLIVAWCSRM